MDQYLQQVLPDNAKRRNDIALEAGILLNKCLTEGSLQKPTSLDQIEEMKGQIKKIIDTAIGNEEKNQLRELLKTKPGPQPLALTKEPGELKELEREKSSLQTGGFK